MLHSLSLPWSLQLNHDVEEKGRCCRLQSPGAPPAGTGSSAPGAGGTSCTSSPEVLRKSAIGNNPFLLHVEVQSGLQIDVEGPETS